MGTNTAECNNAINATKLPSGGRSYFTGTKIISNMGAVNYYYGRDIVPDIYVDECMEDIIAERDAVLQKILEAAHRK